MLKHVKKVTLPFQLLVAIATVVFFGSYVPLEVIRYFYTFSMIFKEFLSGLLPFMVFTFILSGILSFKKNAPIVLGVLLCVVTASNFMAALFSFAVGRSLYDYLVAGSAKAGLVVNELVFPFVQFKLPVFIESQYAMLSAVMLGIVFSFINAPQVKQGALAGKRLVEMILNYCFIPVLPLYVFGFLLKVHHEGAFGILFSSFGKAFSVVLVLQVIYLSVLYFVGANFSLSGAWRAIQNSLPSYLTAFSTMSGAVSLPVSIKCAEINTGNRPVADISMPIMANICLTGDALTVPLFALVAMGMFLGTVPTMIQCVIFIGYFCIALLATSGVPGGGILALLPVLQSVFGFTPAMQSIIMVIYLLQDSFGTACNVMADGGLVMVLNNLLKKLGVHND